MNASSEVVVVAIFDVRPGSEDEAQAILSDTIVATHEEDACRSYALHRDATTPTRFVLVERWASQADLDSHMQTPHLKALVERLPGVAAAPPTVIVTTPVPVGDPGKGTLRTAG